MVQYLQYIPWKYTMHDIYTLKYRMYDIATLKITMFGTEFDAHFLKKHNEE